MLQIFMILLKLGVIALGVKLIVSLSSATDGVLLQEDITSGRGSIIKGTKSS